MEIGVGSDTQESSVLSIKENDLKQIKVGD